MKSIIFYLNWKFDFSECFFFSWKIVKMVLDPLYPSANCNNMAQYWLNLGSQQSAIVIGPVSPFASVKCWAEDDGLFRLFEWTDLQRNLAQYWPYTKPVVTFTMASSSESKRTRIRPMDGTWLVHMSLLPRQSILEVRKREFGTAPAHCCAKNMHWRPEFAAKCIPEL